MIAKKIKSIIVILLCAVMLHTAVQAYVILAVPGQNGLGSNVHYVAQQLGTGSIDFQTGAKKIFLVDIPTMSETIDLGQEHCIAFLKQSYDEHVQDQEYILHATSQGTATVLNFIGKYPEAQKNLKAIILEAPLASGDSAIVYQASQRAWFLPDLFIEKLAPSFVRSTIFPSYDSSGLQAITSIESILKKDIVITLVHSTEDRNLPYFGACALYYRLNELGHEKVYLVTKESSQDHIKILRHSNIVQKILKKNQIFQEQQAHCEVIEGDYHVADCKPDYKIYQDAYEAIIAL